ncbi:MAG: DUF642 domain-containing protein [Armatimonadetes bacterium]|nr:DUF642 domain-containing protein [Armatimonadota bacterium]
MLAAAALSGSAFSNLVVNGDFENEPNYSFGSGYNLFFGTQIPGWTIAAGHGATIHDTTTYPHIAGFSLNTDGEGYNGHNVDMSQNIASVNGLGYELSFDWEGWIGSQCGFEISVTDTVTNSVLASVTRSFSDSLVVHHEAASFVGTGNALNVRIFENPESTYNDNSFIIDDVAVNAVPEPASMTALAAGIAILIKRRRK